MSFPVILRLIAIYKEKKKIAKHFRLHIKPIHSILTDGGGAVYTKKMQKIILEKRPFRKSGLLPLTERLIVLNDELISYHDQNDKGSIKRKGKVDVAQNVKQLGSTIYQKYTDLMDVVKLEQVYLQDELRPTLKAVMRRKNYREDWRKCFGHFDTLLLNLVVDLKTFRPLLAEMDRAGKLDDALTHKNESRQKIKDTLITALAARNIRQALHLIAYAGDRRWFTRAECSLLRSLVSAIKNHDQAALQHSTSNSIVFRTLFTEPEQVFFRQLSKRSAVTRRWFLGVGVGAAMSAATGLGVGKMMADRYYRTARIISPASGGILTFGQPLQLVGEYPAEKNFMKERRQLQYEWWVKTDTRWVLFSQGKEQRVRVRYPFAAGVARLLFVVKEGGRILAQDHIEIQVRELITKSIDTLPGMVVVLDPGHGGNDPGTTVNTYWEDEIAYDVVVRIKAIIEREQLPFFVHSTVYDKDTGYHPLDTLINNKNEVLNFDLDLFPTLLSRNFKIDKKTYSKEVLWLRSFIGNQIFEYYVPKYTAVCKERMPSLHNSEIQSITQQHVVFTSFHCDSAHESEKGLFVAVADPGLRRKELRKNGVTDLFGNSGLEDSSQREVLRARYITADNGNEEYRISNEQFVAHYESSKKFADEIVAACKNSSIQCNEYSVRTKLRDEKNETFVLAVLKYSRIPCSIFIEMGNLNNKEEATLLNAAAYRQRIAEMYVAALVKKYKTLRVLIPQ